MSSHERARLQPWVRDGFKKEPGWLCWKLEDKNRPGLPDMFIRSPAGRMSWVELKWSSHKRTVAVHLAPTQWQHLKELSECTSTKPIGFVLVASPAHDRTFLIPVQVLETARETFHPQQLERLPGVESTSCSRAAVGALLRRVLGP